MKKYMFLAPLALVLAACAQTVWVKPGATQQEFTTDRYNCERDARQSGYFGTGLIGAINMQNFFDSCMNAHGYYAQKTPVVQASATTTADQPPPEQTKVDYTTYQSAPLCIAATTWDGSSWETRAGMQDAVSAAQQRGLTLEQCRGLLSGNAVAQSHISDTTSTAVSRVAMQQEGGGYAVPVLINGTITLNFLVDSGAADVSVPADVVLTLMRAGTIQKADFLGTKTYRLADGSTVPSSTFRIRSLKVGDETINNVTGSVAPVKGELLLGQSFLKRFKTWSIDNKNHNLLLR